MCVCVSHTRATRCYDSRINSRVYIYIYIVRSLWRSITFFAAVRVAFFFFFIMCESWRGGPGLTPPEIKGERRKTLMQLTNRSVRRTHRYTHIKKKLFLVWHVSKSMSVCVCDFWLIVAYIDAPLCVLLFGSNTTDTQQQLMMMTLPSSWLSSNSFSSLNVYACIDHAHRQQTISKKRLWFWISAPNISNGLKVALFQSKCNAHFFCVWRGKLLTHKSKATQMMGRMLFFPLVDPHWPLSKLYMARIVSANCHSTNNQSRKNQKHRLLYTDRKPYTHTHRCSSISIYPLIYMYYTIYYISAGLLCCGL